MKLPLIWMAVALACGVLVASLVTGPYTPATRVDEQAVDFLQSAQLDARTVAILHRACGNCHSNQTQWPWYSHVAPLSWLLRRDVMEGRKFLNFSMWPEYGTDGQGQLLALAATKIKRGSMPPLRYSALHKDGRLSGQQRSDLIAALQQESARLSKTEQSNR